MYIAFICYQESLSEGVKPLLEQLKTEYNDLNYYAMLHDRDIKDKTTGEIKKEHYHVVLDINFNNKSHTIYEKEKIANMFKISVNLIQNVRNEVGLLRYLTHIDNDEKEHYDTCEMITNNIDFVNQCIDLQSANGKECDANEQLEELFSYIDSYNGIFAHSELFVYYRKKKLFFKFASVSKMIMLYIDLHNQKYIEEIESR